MEDDDMTTQQQQQEIVAENHRTDHDKTLDGYLRWDTLLFEPDDSNSLDGAEHVSCEQ